MTAADLAPLLARWSAAESERREGRRQTAADTYRRCRRGLTEAIGTDAPDRVALRDLADDWREEAGRQTRAALRARDARMLITAGILRRCAGELIDALEPEAEGDPECGACSGTGIGYPVDRACRACGGSGAERGGE